MKRHDKQRGSMAVAAIVLTVTLAGAGVVLGKMYKSSKDAEAEHRAADKALNLAEAGTQSILSQLKANSCDPTKLSGATSVGNSVEIVQSMAGVGRFKAVFVPVANKTNTWTVIVKEGGSSRRAAKFPGVTCSTGGVCTTYALVGNKSLYIDDRAQMNGMNVIPCKTSTKHRGRDWKNRGDWDDDDGYHGQGHWSGGGGGHGNSGGGGGNSGGGHGNSGGHGGGNSGGGGGSGGGHHGGLLDYKWKQWFCWLDVVQPAYADHGNSGGGGGNSGGHGGGGGSGDGWGRQRDGWDFHGWGRCRGWGHWHQDCMGDCNVLTSDGALEKQTVTLPDLPNFITSTGAQGDVTVTSNTSKGPGQYNRITVTDSKTLTFNQTGGTYYIKQLNLGDNATLNLAPGDYYITDWNTKDWWWFGSLPEPMWKRWFAGFGLIKPAFAGGHWYDHQGGGDGPSINITPSGVVKLYVQDIDLKNNAQLNTGGAVGNLGIYVYKSFVAGDSADVTGIVYASDASTSIRIGRNASLTGAVLSAGSVTMSNNSRLIYNDAASAAVKALSPTALCAGGGSSSEGQVTPGSWTEDRKDLQ
ncbi:MAG: hypothetical protein HQL66_04345 [Magnetococcales bacterium]|nr:hypothetical protein [Magnetococcales bacterium]